MKKMLLVSMVLAAGLLTTGCTSTGKTSEGSAVSQQQEMKLNVVNVTATADDGNVAENVLDGNLGTRWSSANDAWLMLELDKVAEVSRVDIAFSKGDERTANFALEVSEDGTKWKRVFDGMSSGATKDLEEFAFTAEKAKFVKFVGWGNSYNEWNSLTSVEVIGK